MDKEEKTEWRKNEFFISTEKSRIDSAFVHDFLRLSYWAQNISIEIVRRAIENSLCFGVFAGTKQIGFARVISDYATFAYLCDVFIIEKYRGRGLSKWLIKAIVSHPQLQDLRRWMLATRDAHGLYRQFGFTELANPMIFMERHTPNVYQTDLID